MTTTAELREQIERKGEEISQVAHRIENRIEEYKDWKSTVRRYPFVALGVALGLGVVLSGAAAPILRFAGGQARTVAKGAATAYLMSMVQGKMNTMGSRPV